jgi:SAM-dependent methyltransferase
MNDQSGLGFEIGKPGIRMTGPCRIITGRFFDLLGREPFADGAFDFITAFDVLEHLPDLDKYVHALARLLVPGGHLIVTVPDAGSWMAMLAGRRWNMYLLEHLWFFNVRTLAAFMARAGFRQTHSRKAPYDASLAHIARRLAHTYAPAAASISRALPEIVLPTRAGVMYGVFKHHSAVTSRADQ